MYTIEEYDKEKSKVLKYILYKKRSKQEVKNKFYNTIENEMLDNIIEELEENGYINDLSKERLHHEIYLSDARRVAPEKWKTVIRHPIKKGVRHE